ncbi:uncharacterized protein Z518_10960 [Rhinocladiella mackenziei CBS 650.93]|uniref:RTA1 domain protein n=1 Tax=Rhinocladiella mackenziei CBS 650.93 TaxID=1442369 RepID=A0A0D2GNY9_9EURO|nr:uncharacterized protein Z518_10960 [Rhinocladiella mackenziei CBS 650.93]KIX00033.1 hypothetical protein Z518_10960 [Rhinocladiella mackenziei CBS 650.93]
MATAHPIPDEALSGCTPYNPTILPSYGYKPSLSAGITYCILFSIALLVHCLYGILHRRWANYLLATGAVGELIGWAGRTWSSQCPYNKHAFLMQIVTLVIAPVFFAAALFVMLAQLSVQRGPQYSLIPPRLYLYIFCICDVIALLIQAAGAGIASHEFDTQGDPEKGTHIVVAGLGFQLAAMTVFFLCFVSFIVRSFKQTWPRHEAALVGSMLLSFISLYIRCVYRTVQLAEGWLGYLSRHEPFFLVLDAALMVVCVGIFVPFNPGTLLHLERSVRAREGPEHARKGGILLGWLRRNRVADNKSQNSAGATTDAQGDRESVK